MCDIYGTWNLNLKLNKFAQTRKRSKCLNKSNSIFDGRHWTMNQVPVLAHFKKKSGSSRAICKRRKMGFVRPIWKGNLFVCFFFGDHLEIPCVTISKHQIRIQTQTGLSLKKAKDPPNQDVWCAPCLLDPLLSLPLSPPNFVISSIRRSSASLKIEPHKMALHYCEEEFVDSLFFI